MPKPTFFNLNDEKRERIIDAAINEFASRSYHKARVTAIADNADIAKGSFYQYFDDKEDLFKYIMDLAVKKKLEYINYDMMVNKEKYSFFRLLHEVYSSGIRFAKDNPRLVAIGNMLLSNKDLQRKIWGEYEDVSAEFFQQLLKAGMEKDELDPKIDIALVSRLLTGLNYSLIDIVFNDGIDPDNLEDDMEIIDRMLNLIENGIKKRD